MREKEREREIKVSRGDVVGSLPLIKGWRVAVVVAVRVVDVYVFSPRSFLLFLRRRTGQRPWRR